MWHDDTKILLPLSSNTLRPDANIHISQIVKDFSAHVQLQNVFLSTKFFTHYGFSWKGTHLRRFP